MRVFRDVAVKMIIELPSSCVNCNGFRPMGDVFVYEEGLV